MREAQGGNDVCYITSDFPNQTPNKTASEKLHFKLQEVTISRYKEDVSSGCAFSRRPKFCSVIKWIVK